MTTEVDAIPPEPKEVEWVRRDYFDLVLSEQRSRFEAERAGLRAEIQKWKNAFAGLEGTIAALQQRLYYLQNVYPDLANVHRGIAKWAPDSFKNAIMLIDFAFAQVKTIEMTYRIMHQKKRNLWPYVALIVFAGIVLGVASNPAGAAKFFQDNAVILLVFFIIAGGFFVLYRRSSERKQSRMT